MSASCAFCSSIQRFACGFLRIPPHDGHPCRPASSSPDRVCRGLSPPRSAPCRAHKKKAANASSRPRLPHPNNHIMHYHGTGGLPTRAHLKGHHQHQERTQSLVSLLIKPPDIKTFNYYHRRRTARNAENANRLHIGKLQATRLQVRGFRLTT
jgi:hypothetical protein